jgi:hypothetical protein
MIDYNLRKRFLLFLFGCIGLRTYLVYFAKTTTLNNLINLAYISLIISFGFIYIYITKTRETGFEVFGDKIWWNNLRPLHALFYFLFAYNVLVLKNKDAWKFLAIDVIIGFLAFLQHHQPE